MEQIEDADCGRPSSCPQCRVKEPLTAHGFYKRTIVEEGFDGLIRIRRYLCETCQRTVSLLPEWALPFMRFSIPQIARTVKARLMEKQAWKMAAPGVAYQRGQHWVRRFRQQAESLTAALASVTAVIAASSFVFKALACWRRPVGRARIGFCFQSCGCICWDGDLLWLLTGDESRSIPIPARWERSHTPLAWKGKTDRIRIRFQEVFTRWMIPNLKKSRYFVTA